MTWNEVLARVLAMAELDLRLAQQRHDGSNRARRRYSRAREQLERLERLALQEIGNRP